MVTNATTVPAQLFRHFEITVENTENPMMEETIILFSFTDLQRQVKVTALGRKDGLEVKGTTTSGTSLPGEQSLCEVEIKSLNDNKNVRDKFSIWQKTPFFSFSRHSAVELSSSFDFLVEPRWDIESKSYSHLV